MTSEIARNTNAFYTARSQDLVFRLKWLYQLSDNLHPSLYMSEKRLSAAEKIQMIEGRIDEAHRLLRSISNATHQVLPYFWYKYQDTKAFLSKVSISRWRTPSSEDFCLSGRLVQFVSGDEGE